MDFGPKGFSVVLLQLTTLLSAMAWQSVAVPTTSAPPSATTVAPPNGIKFVELSGEIQVNEGEPVALRCVVNASVDWCKWLWRPLGEADAEPVAVKKFAPAVDQPHDCSVRFLAMLKEQEGLWSCAASLASSAHFVEAPPTSLKLLPPVQLRFLEIPKNKTVAIGHSTILPCVATSAVKDCLWTWYPIHGKSSKGIDVKQFPAFGNHSRDCSINFKNVQMEQDGYWKCSISSGSPGNALKAESPLARLTTFVSEPIEFIEISRDVRIPNGTHLYLHCMVSSSVKECQWTHITSNRTGKSVETVKTFPAHGYRSNDCSTHINVTTEKHEGTWTCGARKEEETFMTRASSFEVTIQKPESVMIALWTVPGDRVTLACQLLSRQPMVDCTWQHLPNLFLTEKNFTKRYVIHKNSSTGLCTILMSTKFEDLGQWRCVFTMMTRYGTREIAEANLSLLTTDSETDLTTHFIVGIVTGLVLLITAVIAILVCKFKTLRRRAKKTLGNPTLRPKTEENKLRYVSNPHKKIFFHFNEAPIPKNSSCTQQTSQQTNHIYEPVDRYLSPIAKKSVYENVE